MLQYILCVLSLPNELNAWEPYQAWLAGEEAGGPSLPGELSSVFAAVFAKMDKKLIQWLKGELAWHMVPLIRCCYEFSIDFN